MNRVKSVTIHISAQLSLPVSGVETHQPAKPQTCGGSCSTCRGGCRKAAETSALGGGHTENPLKQAAGILLKLIQGGYSPEQAEGAFDTIDSLLRSYYGGKGASNG